MVQNLSTVILCCRQMELLVLIISSLVLDCSWHSGHVHIIKYSMFTDANWLANYFKHYKKQQLTTSNKSPSLG